MCDSLKVNRHNKPMRQQNNPKRRMVERLVWRISPSVGQLPKEGRNGKLLTIKVDQRLELCRTHAEVPQLIV